MTITGEPMPNPQDGHEGQTGVTEAEQCPGCRETVHFIIAERKVWCPRRPECNYVDDATGLRSDIAITWED